MNERPNRVLEAGTICLAYVWGSTSPRAVEIEVTSVISESDLGYEVWGYRLDRLRHRFGHMQHQGPRHYFVPADWVERPRRWPPKA